MLKFYYNKIIWKFLLALRAPPREAGWGGLEQGRQAGRGRGRGTVMGNTTSHVAIVKHVMIYLEWLEFLTWKNSLLLPYPMIPGFWSLSYVLNMCFTTSNLHQQMVSKYKHLYDVWSDSCKLSVYTAYTSYIQHPNLP